MYHEYEIKETVTVAMAVGVTQVGDPIEVSQQSVSRSILYCTTAYLRLSRLRFLANVDENGFINIVTVH